MTFKEYTLTNIRRQKWTYLFIAIVWFGVSGLFTFSYALRDHNIWLKVLGTLIFGILSYLPFTLISWIWYRNATKTLTVSPWKELFTSYSFDSGIAYEPTAKHFIEAPSKTIGSFLVTAVTWGRMKFQFHVQPPPLEKHEFEVLEKEFKALGAEFGLLTIDKTYKRKTDLPAQQVYNELEEFAAILAERGFKPGDAKALS